MLFNKKNEGGNGNRGTVIGILALLSLFIFHAGCASKTPLPSRAMGEGGSQKKTQVSKKDASRPQGEAGFSWEVSYKKGVNLLKKGDLSGAETFLIRVVEAAPSRPEVHNALGALYRRTNNLEKAIAQYKMALTLAEKATAREDFTRISSHIHNNLGITYRQKGDFRSAESAYRKAIQLKSDFPDPYYNLGVLYDLYMNRGKDALRYYRGYLSLNGSDKDVEMWVQDLERR